MPQASIAVRRIGPAPPRTAAVPPAMDAERATIRYAVAILLAALLLQRFVLPLAGSFTSVVGPVGFAIAIAAFARGLFRFDRGRLQLYLLFVALALLGATFASLMPPPFGVAMSWTSGLQFLALSGFAVFAFARRVDETRFFRAISACLAFVAIAGLLQFAAQFAGLYAFRFSDVIPPQYLTEILTGGGYNNEIAISYGGSLYKSNGFFLAEPSIFSQFMAVALAIETLYFRRPLRFLLFIAALLASVSGTGWIVLAVFVATLAVSMGGRGLALAVAFLIGLGLALLIWSVVLPDFYASFVGRTGELGETGSSGFIRFVTPFWIAGTVLARVPWALLSGIGFGLSERLSLPYEASVNTPIKIALENGVPVLICYVLLFTLGEQTPRQARLMPALIALLALTGGYSQFAPVLFPLLLLMSIATLSESAPARSFVTRRQLPRAVSRG